MSTADKELLRELLRLDVPQEDAEAAKHIFTDCKDVADTLSNPLVTSDEKRSIISRLFL